MDCAEIRASLLKGVIPRGDDARAHARGCEHCAELLADDARLGLLLAHDVDSTLAPSEANQVAWVDVERALTREAGLRAWLRSRPFWPRSVLIVTILWLLSLVGAVGRKSFEAAPVALAALFALVAAFSAARQQRSLGVFRNLNAARALVALLVAMPLLYVGDLALGGAREAYGTAALFARAALSCFGYGFVLAIPAYAALGFLERRDSPPSDVRAAAAALAGLVGNIALLLHCSIREPLHVLAGHFTIGVALTLLAVLVHKRR